MTFEDADLVAAFVVESLEHLADVENQLLTIEGGGEAIDIDLVNTVFRAVHSVKGAAGFLGLQTINRLAHSLENVLNQVRNQELVPTSERIDVMLRAADLLRQLLESVDHSNEVDVTAHTTKLDAIADGSFVAGQAPATEPAPVAQAAAPAPTPPPVATTPVAPAPVPPAAPAPEPQVTEPEVAIPVAVAEPRGEVANNSRKSDVGPELNIRVPVTVLDRLMNLAGELVLGRNQLLQTIETGDRTALESAAAGLDQVTSELQEAIMQTRMQPIGNVFGKFPRIVRDLSAKLGKQCELVVEGREVEVDKSIIEAISDPLTHLIRNSVDHGLEPPAVRTAAGKRSQGTVVLRAFHQAGKVRIDIQDDGGGINPSVIREKAQQKGLITAEQAATMSDRESLRLIFAPGFSTAAKVTDVSGRGVGMDVVRTNIEKLGGAVDIESTVGAGTTIKITLPLTLAIIPSLIVQGGGQCYALPQVNIVELVRVRADEVSSRVSRIKGSDVLRLRGSLLPLVHLSTALGREEQPRTGKRPLHVVVVEAGQVRYGLVVDEMHDSEEIVVKPLGRHLKQCHYIAGATILGDGHVALILDVSGISAAANLRVEEGRDNQHETLLEADASDNLQTLLLFHNHPSEQFAIPMGLVSRIERVRADQIDSVGGQELLQFRGVTLTLMRVESVIKARPADIQNRTYVVVFDLRGREIGLVIPHLEDIRRISGEI
ncbi:MAG: chemotaxis protein CheA, partial [Planctomycetales bacterium]|nr:chemotaxis protein CheA [Planctomycetales bacterium]